MPSFIYAYISLSSLLLLSPFTILYLSTPPSSLVSHGKLSLSLKSHHILIKYEIKHYLPGCRFVPRDG